MCIRTAEKKASRDPVRQCAAPKTPKKIQELWLPVPLEVCMKRNYWNVPGGGLVNRSPRRLSLLLISLVFGCFAFSPAAQAASRPSPTPGTQDVNVVNTPTVKDTDNPPRNAFAFNDAVSFSGVSPSSSVIDIPVPAGKRLVIEQVGVTTTLAPSASQKLVVEVITTTGGTNSVYWFTGIDAPIDIGLPAFVASSQMRCYADAGSTNYIVVFRNDTSGGSADHGGISVSGYLVDVP